MAQTFASHLVTSWTRNARGRAVLAAWAVAAAGLTITSVLARRRARAAAAAAKRAADADAPTADAVADAAAAPSATAVAAPARRAPSATRLVLRALVPSYRSAPAAHAASLALAIGLRRWAATKVSIEIGALGGLLATRDWEALFAREVQFAIWTLPTAALAAATQYATARLALALRARLEARWRAAVAAGAASRVAAAGAAGCAGGGGAEGGAPSPAEVSLILTAESDALCAELAALFAGVAKPTLEAAMLMGTLGQLMGGRQLGGALLFYALAGGWVRSIGPAWSALRERQASAAAALAARHARLQADAEGTFALGAEAAEAAALERAWDAAARARGALEAQTLLSATVETYALRYVGILAAFTAMSPAVYAAAGPGGGRAAAGATEYFLSALHLLVDLGLCMRDLAGAARVARTVDGLAARVLRLQGDLDAAAAAAEAAAGGGPGGETAGRRVLTDAECVELVAVTIAAPAAAGRAAAAPAAPPLVRALSLRLGAGESVLVRGPNGAGKTALLRVLTGWWTPAAGEVRVPRALRVGYLPQRPLLLAEHSLRQALLYPHEAGAARAHTDGELITALREVGLHALLETAAGGGRGGLDRAGACAGLSGGEAQRLAAARALLARPAFLLLDEPAAATSSDFETWLYAELARRGIGVVTVSHSAAAEAHHGRVLELGGADGQWTVRAGGAAR